MRYIRTFIIATIFISTCLLLWGDAWREIKGDHFIVYYTGDAGFPKDVLNDSEKYYDRIADDLGYSRYSNFWQWQNRVKIYVYPDRESYVRSGPHPEWSHGIANYFKKSIYTYKESDDFLISILPHEITHLMFRDYVGIENENIPLWLDEGVAQWSEPKKRQLIKQVMKRIYSEGGIIPLSEFIRVNIMTEDKEEKVRDYYVQAMSLVDFLIGAYGSKRFINFCRNLRDGKNIEDSLKFAYPVSIRSLADLEKEWRARYVRKL